MRPWIEPQAVPLPPGLSEAAGGSSLLAQALARRGVLDAASARAFLDPAHYSPSPPAGLPGIAQAAARLERALATGEGILVWGDFDVDGQTATALLVAALRDLGGQVQYHIPVRARESHGVGAAVLRQIIESHRDPPLSVLLTCDTGIAAHQAVDYANSLGVDVLITDHHELPPNLPPAQVIANPRLLPDDHPLASLPGVGVAYKLAQELYTRAGRPAAVESCLDLAALGVIADLARLRGEARYLAQRGIALLRTPARLGLQAVMEQAELDPGRLSEQHIAFILAPRLNALGRLADANPAVELLTTSDPGRARLLAIQLEGLNSRRQMLTSQVLRAALKQVEDEPALLDHAALVLSHPSWPAGVIGIVASQLVERFGKPAVLIAAPPGETGRASARSVEGVDIIAAIAAQARLLEGYGGHRMAAGFGIQPERIPEFRRGLSRSVQRQGPPPEPSLAVDAYLEWGELSLDLADDLERLAPFGPGNPPLVLASRDLRLVRMSRLGREGEHLMLLVADETGQSQRVIWWGGGDLAESSAIGEGPFDLAYTLRASSYAGARQLQVEWLDFRPCEEAIPLRSLAPAIQGIDHRKEQLPLSILARLAQDEPELQVWAEAGAAQELVAALKPAQEEASPSVVSVRGRGDLSPCPALAVWTTPPSYAILGAALDRAQPQRCYLFAVDPETGQIEPFLRRLAGLAKYALAHAGGEVDLERLAAAAAQRLSTVRLGLDWLEAHGDMRIAISSPFGSNILRLEPGSGLVLGDRLVEVASALRLALDETRAYRLYFRRAEVDQLLGL
jgi:single-stranded-DNA-specific exonuclease